MFRKTILPNKLRILTAPMKGTNTVTVLILCKTGFDNEPEGKDGISHFLEHMFFKGTKKRPTPQRIMEETVAMGSVSNAFTSHELTGYYIKAGKIYLDQSLDLLADIYQNSLFDTKEIEREKQVIVEELQMRNDSPTSAIWRQWEKVLYGNQSAGREVIGPKEIVRSFKRDDFTRYFNHQYTAKNTFIIVAGNFDEATTISKIKHLFRGIRDFTPRSIAIFKEDQKAPQVLLKEKETDQTHVMLGFRAFPAAHKDRYILSVLEDIVGGNWSSRMFSSIREKHGLAYHVSTSGQAYTNRGYFTTYAGVSHNNVEKVIRLMLEEYRKIIDKPITARELKRSKDHIKGSSMIALESSDAVASFIGEEEATTGKPLTADEFFREIEKVSVTDLSRVAKKLFKNQQLNLAILGPHKDQSKFAKILKL